ncbi:hypothetical protein C8R46DRAFT_446 [Mycena filopes]|nr:hypothetical protein C8R46DRAFT_446 [Mycena filopes]
MSTGCARWGSMAYVCARTECATGETGNGRASARRSMRWAIGTCSLSCTSSRGAQGADAMWIAAVCIVQARAEVDTRGKPAQQRARRKYTVNGRSGRAERRLHFSERYDILRYVMRGYEGSAGPRAPLSAHAHACAPCSHSHPHYHFSHSAPDSTSAPRAARARARAGCSCYSASPPPCVNARTSPRPFPPSRGTVRGRESMIGAGYRDRGVHQGRGHKGCALRLRPLAPFSWMQLGLSRPAGGQSRWGCSHSLGACASRRRCPQVRSLRVCCGSGWGQSRRGWRRGRRRGSGGDVGSGEGWQDASKERVGQWRRRGRLSGCLCPGAGCI